MSVRPPHRLAELTAYVYGEGTPEDRAAFEEHLENCPECQADLAQLERVLPNVHARLRAPLDTSVDGMLALMARAERELQDTRDDGRAQAKRRVSFALAAGALALAAILAVAVFLLPSPNQTPRDSVYSPHHANPDAG
jgi:anti-sigma factor RsiW